MFRSTIVNTARHLGWRQCGDWRRYGPDWYQCFRRGKQYIWIGFERLCGAPDTVESGFHKDPLDYSDGATLAHVKEWLR